MLVLHQADAGLHQVADDGFHVAAHVAHLGELRGLHLDEGRVHQLGQAAGDLGLAHARRADHQDVLRGDFFADVLGQLGAAVAVAQGHGHGALGLVLTDDVSIQLTNDLAGGKLSHLISPFGMQGTQTVRTCAPISPHGPQTVSTMMLPLVNTQISLATFSAFSAISWAGRSVF